MLNVNASCVGVNVKAHLSMPHCSSPLAQGEISPCVCFTTHVWEKPNTCLFGFSTRVCKNTHLCSKDHTDGNCVVCGFYHTHVVKTKHAWKSLSLKFKGGFLPRGPSPFLALMIWNPIVILNDFTLPQIHQVLF